MKLHTQNTSVAPSAQPKPTGTRAGTDSAWEAVKAEMRRDARLSEDSSLEQTQPQSVLELTSGQLALSTPTAESEFNRFWRLGYKRLVPVIPPGAAISERSTLFKRIGTKQDGRGKTPGTRGRDGLWSSFDWSAHEATEDDLARWTEMSAGVGIKTGLQPDGTYLVPIDADTMNRDFAVIIRDEIEARFGRLAIRVGQSPKAMYLLRVSAELPYSRIEFGPNVAAHGEPTRYERVEVLSDGKQFVAEGIHPKTGQPYTWPRGLVAYDEIPVASPADVTALLEALRTKLPAASRVITEGAGNEVSQASLTGPIEAVRAAVAATPNTSNHFPSRESYRDYGYAIKAALPDHPDEAYEIWAEWCARWRDGTNDPDVMASDWRRMKAPFRRGASWLYEIAESHGEFDRSSVWFEPVEDAPRHLSASGTSHLKKIALVPFHEAADTALSSSTKPLVKGLLDQGTLSVVYGPSNVGKTFAAMSIAFHVAAGLPWGDMKVMRGGVVYVAAEGGAGARKRAEALRRHYGAAADGVDFHLILQSLDLRRPDADVGPLIEALRGIGRPVALIVLDTLSRVMAGGEENGSTDMGALVKHFDKIRHATGAHVMVVHHSGKDAARGARGHSLLRAATDTEIEIADRQIAVTKQRDLDKAWSSAFDLKVVTLGRDEDGADITSCVLELAAKEDAPAGVATPSEQIVLDALADILSDNPSGKGASAAAVMDYLSDEESPPTITAVRHHLRNLRRKGLVTKAANDQWRPSRPKMASATWFETLTSDDASVADVAEPVAEGNVQ